MIIYYDFTFAFENIRAFMFQFWRKRNSKHINELKDEDIKAFLDCIDQLDQFYFDSNWINTVAALVDSSKFNQEDIKKLYEIYGHLMTINKSLYSNNTELCKNAYKAMNELMKYSIPLQRGATPEYILDENIKILVDQLKKLAFPNQG